MYYSELTTYFLKFLPLKCNALRYIIEHYFYFDGQNFPYHEGIFILWGKLCDFDMTAEKVFNTFGNTA